MSIVERVFAPRVEGMGKLERRSKNFCAICRSLMTQENIFEKFPLESEKEQEFFMSNFAFHFHKWLAEPPDCLVDQNDNQGRRLRKKLNGILPGGVQSFPHEAKSSFSANSYRLWALDYAARDISQIVFIDLNKNGLVNEFLKRTIKAIKANNAQEEALKRQFCPFELSPEVWENIKTAFKKILNEKSEPDFLSFLHRIVLFLILC